MIEFLLFYRMDWTDRNQGVVFVGMAATLILGCCLDGLLK